MSKEEAEGRKKTLPTLVSGLLLAEDEALVPGPLPQARTQNVAWCASTHDKNTQALEGMVKSSQMWRLQYVPPNGTFSAAPPGFPQVSEPGSERRPGPSVPRLQLRLCLKGLLLPLKFQHRLLLQRLISRATVAAAKIKASLQSTACFWIWAMLSIGLRHYDPNLLNRNVTVHCQNS